jgi:putative membrane protein
MNVHLPAVNASLNALATVLLLAGLAAIKAGRRERHEKLMVSALAASAAFLACYLYYHFVVTRGNVTEYRGTGASKVAYLVLLGTHTVLAMVNLPMVLRTFWLARKERWEAHRRLARWTFPIWLYVSVTGVVVYVVLYHFNPAPPVP